MPFPLIEDKLSVPSGHSGMVRRTRLLRRIRAADGIRVIALIGPPGYGKTSVLTQWAGADGPPVVWLTVDDGDNDPIVLFTYLAAALDRIDPLPPDVFTAIASGPLSERAVVARLLWALSGRTPLRIVIDDAQRLTERACLDALGSFISHLPAGVQVAVASREPVGLPFARWRPQGWLLDIGPADLALDLDEVGELLRQRRLDLSSEATRSLSERTEGWPALLGLAVAAATRSDGRPIAGLSGVREIGDYLRTEVLEGRSRAVSTFLTRTSILERLSAPVCDAVMGHAGSGRLLADLARSTVLVDEYGGSYRYHTLLREVLQDELVVREPARVPELHLRAATWYEAAGDFDQAIGHAFAAGDLDRAATLVGTGFLRYWWSPRRATARAWFRRFDVAALEDRPWLAVLAAWEQLGVGDVAAMDRLADIAERGTFDGRPPDGSASFESGRAMLRAAMCRRGADDMLTNAERAVTLEQASGGWHDFALWTLAFARHVKGDHRGADSALVEAVATARSAAHAGLAYCFIGHRALLAIERGDWALATELVDENAAGPGSTLVDAYVSSAPACAARARVAIHRGDVTGARRELTRALGLRPLLVATVPGVAVVSLLELARTHLAISDAPGARSLVTQAAGVLRHRPGLGVLPDQVAALAAQIASLSIGPAGASSLSVAELRVLALLPYYLSFKEIGERLGVQASTVKTQALSIYGKLGATARGEAVELAIEAGLLHRFPT